MLTRVGNPCHRRGAKSGILALVAVGLVVLAVGCDRGDMKDQARVRPYEPTPFFPNGQSSLKPVEGTVPRPGFDQPTLPPAPPNGFPINVTQQTLERGQERYNIYCSVCHGHTGAGDGMIVRRGFTPPPSLHIERLRNAPPQHYFDVITNGYGAMYPYAARITPEDRWAIAAYIRALQLSQRAPRELLSEKELQQVSEAKQQ